MRVHFVTEGERWILGRWSDEWAKRIPGATVGIKPQGGVANVYVNYFLYEGKTDMDICYFTHREMHDLGMQEAFDKAARECDWCLAQCDITAGLLPEDKITIVKPGVGDHLVKDKIVIGVPVKAQPWNRKRLEALQPIQTRPGVEVRLAGGLIPYEGMDEWYRGVDYVLITSENEGGPMAVLEAVAMGKPFIAPKGVGWCEEYPGYYYDNFEELNRIVDGLVYDKDAWERGARQIVDIVDRLNDV